MKNTSNIHLEIAKTFNFPICTVQRVLHNHNTRGHIKDLPRSGRPPEFNQRPLHYLKWSLDSNGWQIHGIFTQNLNTSLASSVCPGNLRRAIHAVFWMFSFYSYKKPFLKDVYKEKCLAWAKVTTGWGKAEWQRIIWTNESSVRLGKNPWSPLV